MRTSHSSFYIKYALSHFVERPEGADCITGFLIITETPLFKPYILKNWPLLSPTSGFVLLGSSQVLLGNSLLAQLNKKNASQQSLGLAFWRLIISAGIIVFTMGFINILASYVFRDTTLNLTARQVRSNGAVASHKLEVESSVGSATPKQNRKSFHQRFSKYLKPGVSRDSLPSYKAQTYMTQVQSPVPPMPSLSPIQQHASGNLRMPESSDYAQSPQHEYRSEKCAQSPGAASSKYSDDGMIARPNLAHHPAMTHGYAR